MLITKQVLVDYGATCGWLDKFVRAFPDGYEWNGTREDVLFLIRMGFGPQIGFLYDRKLEEQFRVNLPGVDFSDITFNEVDFSHANLDGASFKRASLNKCSFNSASLVNADFTDCEIHETMFRDADLEGAIIPLVEFDDLDWDVQQEVREYIWEHDQEMFNEFVVDGEIGLFVERAAELGVEVTGYNRPWTAGDGTHHSTFEPEVDWNVDGYSSHRYFHFGAVIDIRDALSKWDGLPDDHPKKKEFSEWSARIRQKHGAIIDLLATHTGRAEVCVTFKDDGGDMETNEGDVLDELEWAYLESKYEDEVIPAMQDKVNGILSRTDPDFRKVYLILSNVFDGPTDVANAILHIRKDYDRRYTNYWSTYKWYAIKDTDVLENNGLKTWGEVLDEYPEVKNAFDAAGITDPLEIYELIYNAHCAIEDGYDQVEAVADRAKRAESKRLEKQIGALHEDFLTVAEEMADEMRKTLVDMWEYIGSDEDARERGLYTPDGSLVERPPTIIYLKE